MTTELRVLQPSEWNQWFSSLELAFGGSQEPAEQREQYRSVTEYERSIGIWDGDDVVATTGAFTFRLAVPGGALVPAAGVTMVSVASTHRRRGLLTSMMRRQLDDVRALGEPIAVLTASEPEIYGRFGYGAATRQMSLAIDTDRVRLSVPEGTDEVRLRYARKDEAVDACESVYARLVPGRPGTPAHGPGWERKSLIDPESSRAGGSALQCLLAERDGELVGYTNYHIKPDWDNAGPKGRIVVSDLAALDPAAYAALWRFLFAIDLTSTIEARNRPTDDAVLHLVSDVRRCDIRQRDSLHLRLVDVGAALEARTYRGPLDLVFEVEDAFCPWNAGRWRLTADAKGGASCKRTEDAADLALSVRELGTAYLGGESLGSLALAGRVRELRAGAVAEASSAFVSDVAPWLPRGF
ncbi:GNAT family N-acetyltransferase [Streptomyces poriferorum]|uniref:GNAT family N-acetyltransferase n=1 Tax=Streptomyces poriferorum TaxID=2798799 RepID=A0ABY9IX05_9ACTN|nr:MULTISPECIES: GNAT family N-acetyltransferase [Streptomyces]MBW5250370.1 GNAT family N-acetyltransferase [Streptomyces poriferorum]MBW5257355.1 GNAT family N-acetyltransferase [Streptomyces poriferorum]MDP5311929.1 GNAT family N-acetyltransferase [Streptomyces sp. Alt4]WLQ48306.1 GNAT family N-acetyltransferase [Streptomyces sp. Alt1]WLQ59006.1 GNAT family N-acetyltransferase [Streptomyces sp. Alt2]